MPQAILKPNRDGVTQTWTPVGAATAWQALSDGGPSKYVFAQTNGQRCIVGFESLPANATSVDAVSIFCSIAGDGVASALMISRLGAVDHIEGGPFVPLDSASTPYRFDLPTAPDGSAWTVAKVNALFASPETLEDFGSPFCIGEEAWLAVDYVAAAVPDAPDPTTTLELADDAPVALELGPPETELDLGDDSPVPLDLGPAQTELELPDNFPDDLDLSA